MAGSVTEAWRHDEGSGGRSVTGVHGGCNGKIVKVLGHEKLITKLLINPFVNGLRLVFILIAVFCVSVCVSVISNFSGTGGGGAMLLAPTWRASLGELQQLLLKLT